MRRGRCRDPAVARAGRSRAAAHYLLGTVVKSNGGGPHAADDLLGEARRLGGDRLPELGARRDPMQRTLSLIAREHLSR